MGAAWEQAFDHQVDLYTFWGTPLGEMFADGYVQSIVDKNPGDDAQVRSIFGPLARRARRALINADPIWVDPDMMRLVEAASESFEPEPLLPSDMITEYGFVYLPRPFQMTDVHGWSVTVRAISWQPATYEFAWTPEGQRPIEARHGIYMFMYHSVTDPDDVDRQMEADIKAQGRAFRIERERRLRELTAITGGLVLTHVTPWVFGYAFPDSENEDIQRDTRAALLGHGRALLHESIEGPNFRVIGLGEIARFCQVLFRMMTQQITVQSKVHPDRQARKRAARVNFPEKHVTVVTLRRAINPHEHEEDTEAVNWTHRWIVSGHWRQQWYSSLHQHRQIWISPYVKGPEDKPLIVRPLRAFRLTR